MSTSREIAQFIDEVDRRCRAVLAAEDTNEAGIDLWGFGLSAISGAERPVRDWSSGLWLVWGSLTDGFTSPRSTPETRAGAVDGMRRAAHEWLEPPRADHEARRRYLDRWVHEECGYESAEET